MLRTCMIFIFSKLVLISSLILTFLNELKLTKNIVWIIKEILRFIEINTKTVDYG